MSSRKTAAFSPELFAIYLIRYRTACGANRQKAPASPRFFKKTGKIRRSTAQKFTIFAVETTERGLLPETSSLKAEYARCRVSHRRICGLEAAYVCASRLREMRRPVSPGAEPNADRLCVPPFRCGLPRFESFLLLFDGRDGVWPLMHLLYQPRVTGSVTFFDFRFLFPEIFRFSPVERDKDSPSRPDTGL